MLVGKIMTPNPVTVSPGASHRAAFELLRKHNISQLPVVEHGRLVGIVSEEDLLSTQPSPATVLSIHEIYALLEKLQVRQFMTRPVYTVEEDCPVEIAARIMLDRDLGCLPIMRGAELVGILSVTDIFKVLVEVLGGDRPGLRFTVRVADTPGTLGKVAEAIYAAGGNIVSVVTWLPEGTPEYALTIKESGADCDVLRDKLDAAGAELIELYEGNGIMPGVFGVDD